MAERLYVARDEEIERLDFVRIRLRLVERGQWAHNRRATDGDPPDSGHAPETEPWRNDPVRAGDQVMPDLRDPVAVLRLGVGGIQQMTKAVLRPSILVVV
jgi:hypothetical protein